MIDCPSLRRRQIGADCVAISRSVAMEGARLRVLSQAVQALSFNKGVADASAIPRGIEPLSTPARCWLTLLFLCFGQGAKLGIRQMHLYSCHALYFVGANVNDLRA